MTRATRRILYISAFAIFFLGAPPIIFFTAGWEWHGFSQGWTRGGVILVSSTPRATLQIQGTTVGQTPQHIRNVSPNAYQLALHRTGYLPWQQEVQVKAGQATVIGPVTLIRATPFVTLKAKQPGTGTWLVDQTRHHLIWISTGGKNITAQVVAPTMERRVWTLPFLPTSVISSPRGETYVFQNGKEQVIATPANTAVWTSSVAHDVSWSDISDHIFLGKNDRGTIVFDTLSETETELGPVQSAAFAFGTLWTTHTVSDVTTVQRQRYPVTGTAIDAFSRPGNWTLWPITPNALFLREAQSHNVEYWPMTPQFHTIGIQLGAMDALFWSNRGTPMIWRAGVDSLTIDTKNHPQLLERTPDTLLWLGWMKAPNILISQTESTLQFRSVSSLQGFGPIGSYRLPNSATTIIDSANGLAWVGSPDGQLATWSWR